LIKEAIDDEKCTIGVLQLNVVRRYIHFKKDATINITGNVLSYDGDDTDELTVDEYKAKYHGKM